MILTRKDGKGDGWREIYREGRIGIEGKGKDGCDADSKTEFCREQVGDGRENKFKKKD